MKKVIRGKVYNTNTAKKIYCDNSGPETETLYQKKTGEFFIEHKDAWGNGGYIAIMHISEAKTWLKKHGAIELDPSTI